MRQWEYDLESLRADSSIDEAKTYLTRRWPGKAFAKYAVEGLIPALK